MKRYLQRALWGLVILVGVVALLGTLLPFIDSEIWWVRAWGFPRYQLLILALVSLTGGVGLFRWKGGPRWLAALGVCLALAAGYQAWRIYPYTPLSEPMSKAAEPGAAGPKFKLLVANVLMHNDRSGPLKELVRRTSPDLVLFVETDKAWVDRLRPIFEGYPHRISVPLGNTYGMLMISRWPLKGSEVRYLMQRDVPSIRTRVQMPSGHEVWFYGLHPRPPAPQESKSSLPRDAELVLVADEIRDAPNRPTIVAGDMNDVAWSTTTLLFLKVSGLLDPRRGRGMFNTFHVGIPPLRVPLDHIFHSEDFTVVDIERQEDIHSDHFPMLITLQLEPLARHKQEGMKMDEEDAKEAQEKLDEANKDELTDPSHEAKKADVSEKDND